MLQIYKPQAETKLTTKQREALDLLIQHKTSKEISRILGISPHTVDQRIEAAKRKFAVATRGELAQAYRGTLPMGQQMTYGNSYMAADSLHPESSISDEPDRPNALLDPKWSGRPEPDEAQKGYQVIPELFSGPSGTIYRLAAIVVMAFLLVVVLLGGISIFVEMTQILDR